LAEYAASADAAAADLPHNGAVEPTASLPPSARLHLGLDLGGTNVKAAVLAGEGPDLQVLETLHAPTSRDGSRAVVEGMIELGRQAIARTGPVATIGVGVPGVYERETGIVRFLTNVPGDWDGVQVGGPIGRALGAPVDMVNDARAFALAESRLGAGRDADTMVGVTLGTGMGGGIVIAGRLHEGLAGSAGEIGHVVVDPAGPPCGCGSNGCAEAYVSARAFAESAGRDDPGEVFVAAAAGDRDALAAVDRFAGYLGLALGSVVVTLAPDRIVVGGGVAQAGELLFGPLRAAVRARVRNLVPVDRIAIVPAELGPNAGAIGAALRGLDALPS